MDGVNYIRWDNIFTANRSLENVCIAKPDSSILFQRKTLLMFQEYLWRYILHNINGKKKVRGAYQT